MEISLIEIWHAMGTLAKAVLFVLLGMSIWTLWVGIDKFILFTRAKKQSLRFVEELTQEMEAQNLDRALELTQEKRFRRSHIAKVVNAGLQEFLRIMKIRSAATGNPEVEEVEMESRKILERTQHAMERAAIILTHDLKKGLPVLATVGATAPFVGLFGTVVGVINAFQAIKTAGAGAIGQVSGGIAEALVETATGLFVAIPAVWLYNYFTTRLERFQHEMGNVTADLLDYLLDVVEVTYAKRS